MNQKFVGLFMLIVVTNLCAQRQNTETPTLRVSTTSFQNMINNENNALEYHKSVNQAIKDILDGRVVEGISVLKPALSGAQITMPIDWFMAGIAYGHLNDKQSVELMFQEAIGRDRTIDSLIRVSACSNMMTALFGESAWNDFLNKRRDKLILRPDSKLIQTLSYLEKLDKEIERLEKTHKDSILVHHKGDKKTIEKHQAQIQEAKTRRDQAYTNVIYTEAWPFDKYRKLGQSNFIIEYDDTPEWYQKNEVQLINLLNIGKLLPWEFAFIHDWHAKRHRQSQKYALFYGQRLDEKIVMNCETIGMPWGEVRNIRMYYILPKQF